MARTLSSLSMLPKVKEYKIETFLKNLGTANPLINSGHAVLVVYKIRKYGKNDKERLDVIWNKGQVVKGYNEKCYRKDACGAWMIREKYGDRTSPFGWEIDHIYPKSKLSESISDVSLIDDVKNLRPLNWKNNESKGNDYPSYQAKITSDGNKNVEGVYEYTVNEETQKIIEQLFKSKLC